MVNTSQLRFKMDYVPGHFRQNGKYIKPHFRRVIARAPEKPIRGDETEQPSWMMADDAPAISCRNCAHFRWEKPGTCRAFPRGIPNDIAYGRVAHIQTTGEDGGVIFDHWTTKADEDA